ncbi:hypothetical protein [Nocardioides sp.]|uniref:hypothetical protein n=1 Tax=Nocardioides sp. TaxID=35761 RepID=UPI00271E61D5|nr:hypothetical protein [Nocardioides sp.]MDO9458347.1 hypothetical protein [Nocardioides sp.]
MTTDLPATPAVAAPPARPRPRRRWRRIVVENLAVVAVFVAAGVGGGFLWSRLWDPPMGAVQDGEWLYLDYATIGHVFSGTALYVVIGVLGGLALGILAAFACRASEVVTLAAILVGSALAGYLAYRIGLERSPANPRLLALVLPDETVLPGALRVSGHSPFVAWPFGALVGLATTYLFTSGVSAGADNARRVELGGPGAGPGTPGVTAAPTHRG